MHNEPTQNAAAVGKPAAAFFAHRLVRASRFKEAVQAYDALLGEDPKQGHLWINRGVALQGMGLLGDALASYEKAASVHDGPYAAALINRAVVLNWLSRYDEALADYTAALLLEPTNESALLGRSTVYSSMGMFACAMADAEAVLAQNMGYGAAHYNKALSLLSKGDYREGFREHEWRFGTNSVLGQYRYPQQVWTGQDTRRRILVYCEQGLGDQIQFMRYLGLMAGLDVVVEAPDAMARLFEPFDFPVLRRGQELPPFDLQCPIMSLGAIFGTAVDTVPYKGGYLCAPEEESHYWQTKIGQLSGLKVGVAWSSGVRPEQPIAVAMHKRKTIPTEAFRRILDVPGVTFVSLQKDVPEGGIPEGLYDPMPQVSDLADTAAIIQHLDLVISVDSAVAHLAGALGKPVWVLNRSDICWRWLSGEVESPWYSTARIYRQERPFHWGDMLAQVRTDLQRHVCENQPSS